MIEHLYSIKTDKLLHFIVSLMIMQICFGILHFFLLAKWNLPISLGITILIGFVKELWDKKKKGAFSKLDFVADLFGALFGFILTTIIIM